ncbi:hypothetical protein CA13_57250 [Planctomycetes bacterium CA13]|uniref:Right handed beta helix domain-containing protein n=1 Tax=Novipirellula herctigrandis TaxID=2527986 RepID=A0A5C5ZA60_9BACT|nr:hypothetical protein CA13_57250 [Planctomycetes bacterium CA13]
MQIHPAFLAIVSLCLLLNHSHAATIVVSTAGDDNAAGTAVAPFRTISRAAEIAMPGDTVFVTAGTYRERVSPPRGGEPNKPIIYRGEELGRVFIKGSDLWQPKWTKHSEFVYYAVPDESMFTDDACLDSPNPFRVEMASTPHGRNGKPEKERFGYGDPTLIYNCGQVIVGDKLLTQMPFLSEVEQQADTWTFDPVSGRIYIHFGGRAPSQQTVEITTRRRVFASHRLGLGHIVIEGFVLEHCGNNYPTNFWSTPIWGQAGALGLRGGHHWVVRNNMIRYANTIAIDIGSRGGNNESAPSAKTEPLTDADLEKFGCDNRIESNYFVDNGAAGLIGSGSERIVIRGNVILRNNSLGFVGNKRYEHAGIKCHGIRDGLIEGNYVADNPLNDGIWLDNQFPNTRITRNVIINNGVKGIFLEMSDEDWDSAFVDHNIVLGNDLNQFYVHDASGSTVMHNLFANSPAESRNGQGAYIYQVTARTRTYHHSLFNNLFVNHKVMMDIDYPSHRGGPQRLDHNVYDTSAEQRVFLVNSFSDKPSPWSPAEFIDLVDRDLGQSSTGRDSLDGGNKANLTFDQWRAFWLSHGLRNDEHSVLEKGMSVSYEPKSHELTVFVPFDPKVVGSQPSEVVEKDFWLRPISKSGNASPGPFQNLKQGMNVFRIWDGLPMLGTGDLPGSN